MDPALPIAPIARTLENQLGAPATKNPLEHWSFFSQWTRETWEQLSSSGVADWKERGLEVDRALTSEANDMLADFQSPVWRQEGLREEVKRVGEARAIEAGAEHFREIYQGLSSFSNARARLDAWARVFALHSVRSVLGNPMQRGNDREDLRLLQHLAAPVFLVTDDNALIDRVDQSGTFQAPWVRTPAEVLFSELPAGRPWGTYAIRASKAFRRGDLRELRKQIDATFPRPAVKQDLHAGLEPETGRNPPSAENFELTVERQR